MLTIYYVAEIRGRNFLDYQFKGLYKMDTIFSYHYNVIILFKFMLQNTKKSLKLLLKIYLTWKSFALKIVLLKFVLFYLIFIDSFFPSLLILISPYLHNLMTASNI